MKRKFLILYLFLFSFCEGTDLKPWFGNAYEFEIYTKLLYQSYESLYVPTHGNFKYESTDLFMTMSIAYPFKRYCGEFEATGSHTHHQKKLGWDNFRFTGRYLWLTEAEGDKFSVSLNLTFTEPYSKALHDFSSFHHGHAEAEGTLSVGKKYGKICGNQFTFRWWNVVGMGIAEEGFPWVRDDLLFEYYYGNNHMFRAFIYTLGGLGAYNLRPHHFKGYGRVSHKSIDIGFRYSFEAGWWGRLSLEYARRVRASNYPQDVNLVQFEYYLPFGSQPTCSY